MNIEMICDCLIEAVEELLELHRTVTTMGLADHYAGCGVERSEEGRGAMTFVIVSSLLRKARSHGQQRLSAVEGLNLGLLVDAQDHRPLRRIQVETDDVADLFDE